MDCSSTIATQAELDEKARLQDVCSTDWFEDGKDPLLPSVDEVNAAHHEKLCQREEWRRENKKSRKFR